MGRVPDSVATWGVDPIRYRRALLRIHRNAAARWAELRALRYSNPNDWPDDGDESKAQAALALLPLIGGNDPLC